MKKKIWKYLLFFSLPALFILLKGILDNDLWYILAEGREIVNNGIYYQDVLSIHQGLDIVVQNWLSAVIFWLVFDFFKEIGLIVLVIGVNFIICLLLFKISMLLSDNNENLSLIIMLLCDFILSINYIVTRPQIFSFAILLAVIYVLELYIKTKKKRYLLWLPFLSLLEINLHASLWWMMFLFILPYVIDSFKCEKLKLQGFEKKPFFLAIVVSLLVGFINPYTVDAITFIFRSYGNKLMHLYILELGPFTFNSLTCYIIFGIALTIMLCFGYFKNGRMRVRYLCLIAGTLILGFITIKALSHFILVAFFPFAYFFRDIYPKNIKINNKVLKTIIQVFTIILAIASMGGTMVLFAINSKNIALSNGLSNAMAVLQMYADPKTSTVYSSFNNGGTVEFAGFKSYIDPRAEVFLKKNNHKEDIFEENYKLQTGQLDYQEFIKKYDFTHILVDTSDALFYNIDNEKYIIIYEEGRVGVRLYARRDLFTVEEIKIIEEQYEASLKNAEEMTKVQDNITNTSVNKKDKGKK
ncbi:MAG: hypothetical protein GX951_03605 [Mollicutes bacterium]|nr:hypothetical protein [Mollicutes bacterium]